MNKHKGYIIKVLRHREYIAVFKKGNKAIRCFKYTNTAKGWRPSMIKDPINWAEDCEVVSVPRDAPFNLFWDAPVLWDAMHLLENKIKCEGW